MSHVRQQIRAAAVAALQPVCDHVFAARVRPLAEDQLPSMLVYTTQEAAEAVNFQDLQREVDLVIECVVKTPHDPQDALDDLAADVEAAIGALTSIDTGTVQTILQNTEIQISRDADTLTGVAKLTFIARYFTSPTDAEVATA